MTVRYSIRNIQRLQQAHLNMIEALKPETLRDEITKEVTTTVYRRVVVNAPVDTGTLRAAQRMRIIGKGGTNWIGEIYTDKSVRNPRSKEMPAQYIRDLHQRGGNYAFYPRSLEEAGPQAVRKALNKVMRMLR